MRTGIDSPVHPLAALRVQHLLLGCQQAHGQASLARDSATRLLHRSRHLRSIAVTLLVQGDTPWPESATLNRDTLLS